MFYGHEVGSSTDENLFGVPKNFTIFTGQQLLGKIDAYHLSKQLPNSEEANVDGFLTAVSNRKKQLIF